MVSCPSAYPLPKITRAWYELEAMGNRHKSFNHLATEHPYLSCSKAPGGLIWLSWGLRDFTHCPLKVPIPSKQIWCYIVVLQGTPTLTLDDGPHPLSAGLAVCACTKGGTFHWQDRGEQYTRFLIWIWQTPPLIRGISPPVGSCLLFHLV